MTALRTQQEGAQCPKRKTHRVHARQPTLGTGANSRRKRRTRGIRKDSSIWCSVFAMSSMRKGRRAPVRIPLPQKTTRSEQDRSSECLEPAAEGWLVMTVSDRHAIGARPLKGNPSEREETPLDICIYCAEEITQQQHPCKAMQDGKRAHLACYVDHMVDNENKLGR
jgi:hypothetical protein